MAVSSLFYILYFFNPLQGSPATPFSRDPTILPIMRILSTTRANKKCASICVRKKRHSVATIPSPAISAPAIQITSNCTRQGGATAKTFAEDLFTQTKYEVRNGKTKHGVAHELDAEHILSECVTSINSLTVKLYKCSSFCTNAWQV